MRIWIGMKSGMDKYWIIPRVRDKELPRVGHQLASCSLLNSYVLMTHKGKKGYFFNLPSETVMVKTVNSFKAKVDPLIRQS